MPQQLFFQIMACAQKLNASDIHIEALENIYQVRFRINKILGKYSALSQQTAAQIISKIKILAGLDFAEHRLPQDGMLNLNLPTGLIEARVSSCPGIYGEKIVLRLLKTNKYLLKFDQLGLTKPQQELISHAIKADHGLILVNGPTGSGKTTTIYALLDLLNNSHKNIITVENPVEIKMPGIHQIQINAKINLDFPMILKFILRQDPDIIVLGEIRDASTAQFALSAAQTGHLVIASLHSTDPKMAIARLGQLGVNKIDLLEVLKLIITQRLIVNKTLTGRFSLHVS